jgi:hypothetical protein
MRVPTLTTTAIIKHICYLPAARSVRKNIFPTSQKRPEAEGRGTILKQVGTYLLVRTDLNGK